MLYYITETDKGFDLHIVYERDRVAYERQFKGRIICVSNSLLNAWALLMELRNSRKD